MAIDVLRRNYPDSSNYYDVNWVATQVHAAVPGYTADFNGDLLAFEIENFAQQLKQVYSGKSNICSFSSLEGLINITGTMDKLGHVVWSIETRYPVGTGAKFNFTLAADQTYLPDLIASLELVTKEFPVLNRNTQSYNR